MEVTVSELRRRLKLCIEEAQAGRPVLITDRGRPAAKLIAAESDRWRSEGLTTSRRQPLKSKMTGAKRVPTHGSVADLIQRR